MMPRPVRLEPVVSWKEYVDRRFDDADKANERERAILIRQNDERWRINEADHGKMNEIRQQLNVQARDFTPMAAFEVYKAANDKEVDALKSFQSRLAGGFGLAVALAVILPVVFHFLK